MKCYHCGQEIENGAATCIYCGANQGAGATVVLDQVFNPYAAESENGRTDPLEEQIRSCSQAQDYGAQDYGTQNYGAQNYGAQNYGQQPQIPNPKFTQAQKYAGYSQNQGYAGGAPCSSFPPAGAWQRCSFWDCLPSAFTTS